MVARDFPTEIWTLIFNDDHYSRKELYHLALINKKCHAILNPKLWRKPSDYPTKPSFEQLLDCLLCAEHYNKTHNLCLSQTPGQHIRQLPPLDLKLTDSLLSLLARTPLLTELSLSIERGYKGGKDKERLQHSKDILTRFPQLCPGLTRLVLGGTYLTTDLIESLSQHCRQLKDLSIHCGNIESHTTLQSLAKLPLVSITLEGSAWMINKYTATHLCQITTLTSLSLRHCGNGVPFLRQLLPTTANNNKIGLPLLTEFIFYPWHYSSFILCSLLDAFFETHPLLESVTLGECDLENSNLNVMGRHLTNLKHLKIYGHGEDTITGDGIEFLAKNCLALESIGFDENKREPIRFKTLGTWRRGSLGVEQLDRIRNNIPFDDDNIPFDYDSSSEESYNSAGDDPWN